MQDCSISIANALEILQSCTKPLYVNISMLSQQSDASYNVLIDDQMQLRNIFDIKSSLCILHIHFWCYNFFILFKTKLKNGTLETWPVFLLLCVRNFISLSTTRIGSREGVELFFTSRHSGDVKYLFIIVVTYHLGTHVIAPLSVMMSWLPAPSNKREAAGACHGNLIDSTLFRWGAFCGHHLSQVYWF